MDIWGDYMKDYIENYIRPRIQGDGGEVEFAGFEDGKLTLRFRGECSKCHILDRCCDWIKERIAQEKGLSVEIIPIRKKPYFQDR